MPRSDPEALVRARKARGLSQEALGKAVGRARTVRMSTPLSGRRLRNAPRPPGTDSLADLTWALARDLIAAGFKIHDCAGKAPGGGVCLTPGSNAPR